MIILLFIYHLLFFEVFVNSLLTTDEKKQKLTFKFFHLSNWFGAKFKLQTLINTHYVFRCCNLWPIGYKFGLKINPIQGPI